MSETQSDYPKDKPRRWQVDADFWQKLKPLAKQMRQEPTKVERVLWGQLRKNRLRVKFRRQHAIERFIVDFYCSEVRLVIEVDGGVHQYTDEEDLIRQEYLEALGMRVIRFQNEEVEKNLGGVVRAIRLVVEELQTPSGLKPTSPVDGGGSSVSGE